MDRIETLINGVLLGALYGLLGLGLALVFGVMRVVNLAHGEFIVLAAYAGTMLAALAPGVNPLLWLLPVAALAFGVGYALQAALVNRTVRTGDPLTPLPERGPTWVGDQVTYAGMHSRLRQFRGRARDQRCVDCGGRAEHWSYDHSDPNARIDAATGLPFSPDVDRYMPRCRTCHRRHDAGRHVRACQVEGCDRQHKAKGLCSKHYQASRAGGARR